MTAVSDVATRNLAVERVAVDRLRPHPRNPRRIRPERLEQLKRSLEAEPEMLDARPLIALPDGTVVAGNQRLAAAVALGWSEIPVVFADLTAARATEWMLRDNQGYGEQLDDLAGELLAELAAAGGDLDLTGYEPGAVDALLRAAAARDVDPDEAPALPSGTPRSRLGDVYELGPHRLMCGDAFDPAAHDLLGFKPDCILTDPPYGIGLDTDYTKLPVGSSRMEMTLSQKRKTYRAVIGDDAPFDASWLVDRYSKTREQFWFGADYYRNTLSGDDHDGSYLVWDKRSETTDGVLGSGFELIWSRVSHKRDLLRHYWCGAIGVAEARNRMHPTQKPTSLLAEILDRWTKPDALVADFFAGAGSTLIAAEQTGRRCCAMEIDPAYCDVVRDRYERFVA